MPDHRKEILEVGPALLREHGLAGLSQPKIAAKTGLQQSHLTYYYPTRIALLTAVTRVAIESQLAAARPMVKEASSIRETTSTIAAVTVVHENTRVLAALNQAADQEPAVRALFNELLGGFAAELQALLEKLGLPTNEPQVDLVHALFVGLSIIDLPIARRKGKARAEAVLNLAFTLLSGDKHSISNEKEKFPMTHLQILSWLCVVGYGAHILEEFVFDWRIWSHQVLHLPTRWGDFSITNCLVIVVAIVAAMIAPEYPAVALGFPALMLINSTFMHIPPSFSSTLDSRLV